jgi:hypothetical protein
MATQAKLRLWVPWYEFASTTRGTLDEFRDVLRKFRPSSLLIACARLSVAFNFGTDGGTAAEFERTKKWIPDLFPPKYVSRALRYVELERILFFQAQLRYLAAEVVRLDPAPSESLPPAENNDLGELLLRAGELLYAPHPILTDRLDKMADLLARFLPVYEIDTPTDPFLPLIRFYIFLTVNIPRMQDRGRKFNVAAEFEKLFNIPLKTYCQFVFSFVMHAVNERETRPPNALIDAGIRVSWFNRTSVPTDLIEKIFKTVCFTLDMLPPKNMPAGYGDFDFLKDNPYFRYDDVLYCLDYDFALGKLESGAVWRVLRSLPVADQNPYLSFWGYVFEDHVAWILETYASKKYNTIYPSPRYENDPQEEICDVIVVCGRTAILIEAKLGTCPTKTRHSGDYTKMRKYLEERLVVGTNNPAAIAQLHKAIEKITTAVPYSLPPWLRGIRKFIPVVMTRDEIGSCWSINSYLDARFEEMVKVNRKAAKAYTITPLVSMSVSTLERCVRKLKDMSFSVILEDRIKSDRDLGRPFEAASKYVHRGTARNMSEHLKILHELNEEIINDFGMVDE